MSILAPLPSCTNPTLVPHAYVLHSGLFDNDFLTQFPACCCHGSSHPACMAEATTTRHCAPQRTLNTDLANKLRASSQAAERKSKERAAVLLDGRAKPVKVLWVSHMSLFTVDDFYSRVNSQSADMSV